MTILKEPVALLIESLFPDRSLVLQPDGLFLYSPPGETPVYINRHAAQHKVVEAMRVQGLIQNANRKVAERWLRVLPLHEVYGQLTEMSRAGFLLYEYAGVLFPPLIHDNPERPASPIPRNLNAMTLTQKNGNEPS